MKEVWDKIVEFFKNNYSNILIALGIFVIGIILIMLIMRIIKASFRKGGMEPIAARFIAAIIRFVLLLVLILICIRSLGFEITGLTTAISAILLAIGVALKEAIANIANGLIIISSQKFKQGDYIVTSGVEGSIQDINFIFVTLKTPDGKQVTLPNSILVNNPVINLGAYPTRRVSFELNVAYETDLELAKKVVLAAVNSCGLVRNEPKPTCRLKSLDNSSVMLFTTCWVDNEDYWDAYYEILDRIFNEFKRNNISIPYQQIEIRERKEEVVMPVVGDKLPERVEKVRKKNNSKIDINAIEELPIKELGKKLTKRHKTSKK